MMITADSITCTCWQSTPGFNFGGSGMNSTCGWYGDTAIFVPRTINSQGIANILNVNATKVGVGDFNIVDLNVQSMGGLVDPAGEGLSVVRPYLTIGLGPYRASIAPGRGGVGATSLGLQVITNGANAGVGQTLLDMSDGVVACNVTAAATAPGNAAVDGSYALLTTDAVWSPSQRVTLTADSAATCDDQNAGTVQTLSIDLHGGPAIPLGGLLKIGGVFTESVRALSVSPPQPDGTQQITAKVRAQHWAGTVAMLGGPAGMYLEMTRYTKNGIRFVSHVLGAVDAHTLAVFNATPGGMDSGYLGTGPALLYKGATLTDVRDPGTSNMTGSNLQVQDNDAAWADGAGVESPNHFSCNWQTYISLVQNANPFSHGRHFNVQGSGAAFGSLAGGEVFYFRNAEPASSYTSAGGLYTPATFFSLHGVFGTLFDLDTPPSGQMFLMPGDDACLIAMKQHNAYISFDMSDNRGTWHLVADQIMLPQATFNPLSGVALRNTSVRGGDGAGSPSLTCLAPEHGTVALNVQGDTQLQGRVFINGKRGYSGTRKAGLYSFIISNGLIQNVILTATATAPAKPVQRSWKARVADGVIAWLHRHATT